MSAWIPGDAPVLHLEGERPAVPQDPAAHLLDLAGNGFPELARPVFWIEEFFDEGGFHLFFLSWENLPEHVFEHRRDRQPPDPLRAPVGGDFTRVAPPELFGVALEKHGVKHPAEPVDIKVFKRVLRQLMYHRVQVAEPRLHGAARGPMFLKVWSFMLMG